MAYQTRKKRLHLWIIDPQGLVKYFDDKSWNSAYKGATFSGFIALLLRTIEVQNDTSDAGLHLGVNEDRIVFLFASGQDYLR